MTRRVRSIEEVEIGLPHGFHDATLLALNWDCEAARATFTFNVLFGSPESEADPEPKYRRGELIVSGVAFLSIDVPRSMSAGAPWLTSGSGQPSTAPAALPKLPEGCFLHWFFVKQWNGFIRIAAIDAFFRWTDS
jgi:hypothetical protein